MQRRHAQSVATLLASAGALWTWLERIHTTRFVIDLVRSPGARTAWHIAQSPATHTVLLAAILGACLACWVKLRKPAPRKRGTRRRS